ncbi:hypothetical protein UO65_4872 [Actinokineospora spheciospongiae]|uniref:Peptidoglycan binding-like domain-containing protein n=1 Tax=Actinokineospora spheciospongiae TaxID=909613 RepID=W7J179_9PSEU|nr:peptidoglycan-binding domain-containing protein [Actinokineospora spheciospongiae]EWC59869.1 hypothetical protein UO65_4872 [Actinokineospora spheciospongiae]
MPALPTSDITALPLVLAGPIVRRVEATGATVWIALKAARSVALDVYPETGDTATSRIATATAPTARIGANLHVVAVKVTGAFEAGKIFRYQLRFGDHAAAEVPADAPNLFTDNVVAATGAEARRRLVYTSGPALPSFMTPPAEVAGLRLFHTGCRKPHGDGQDAMVLLDDVLAADAGRAERRPQQLFLTGDQIYADDVADVVLHLCDQQGRALFGRTEALPGVTDGELAVGARQDTARQKAGASARSCPNHLLRASEFAVAHLLAWSEVLWPAGDLATLLADVHPALASALAVRPGERPSTPTTGHRDWGAVDAAGKEFTDTAEKLGAFRDGLIGVRRALANTATYMVLDDHEVSDDWFASQQLLTGMIGAPLGRRLLSNALSAFAVFQAWGNTPDEFAADRPGGRLLAALAAPDPTAAQPAAEIARRVGVPTGLVAGTVDREDGELPWHYRIEWAAHQAVVLDTRTRRFYPWGGKDPGLLFHGDSPMQAMVDVAADTGLDKVTLVVSSAPVVGHPFLAGFARPEVRGIRADAADLADDSDGWGQTGLAFEALIARLLTRPDAAGTPAARRRRVVVLSGDVGYGYAARMGYEGTAAFLRPGTGAVRGVVAQLTAGSAKGETPNSLFLHQNGTVVRSKVVPSVERVGWANDELVPITAGEMPDPANPGRFLPWRVGGFPAVAETTPAHVLSKTPEWRYRVDFYRHEDPNRLVPREGNPPNVITYPEEPVPRADALKWYVRVAQKHAAYKDTYGDGKQLVGRNNIGEIGFAWEDGDAKSVVQTLWWRLEKTPEDKPNRGAPLTRLAVPLDVGQASNYPPENLPPLYGDTLLEEGAQDTAGSAHVLALQEDLRELGFLMHDCTGRFDRFTRWAVRDFQTYAKRGRVARIGSAFTRLAADVTAAATELTVESTSGFPAAPFRVRLGFENVEVTAVTGTKWTVGRGKDGTGAARAGAADGVTLLPHDTSADAAHQWYGWASALESVDVPPRQRYTGTVSGDVDGPTRKALSRWKEYRWRCPVVVEMWTPRDSADAKLVALDAFAQTPLRAARPARLADNMWYWFEGKWGYGRTVFSRDFSDKWPRPAAHPVDTTARERRTKLGYVNEFTIATGGPYHGGAGDPQYGHSWAEAEMTSESVLGQPLTALAGATLSTFKVVRAVAEVEMLGYFDALNTYDHAFASWGLCHWTMGKRDEDANPREMWGADPGEFWAFVAYLKTNYRASFDRVFGEAGIEADRAWTDDGKQGVDGAIPWTWRERKYVAEGMRSIRDGSMVALTGVAKPGFTEYGEYGELEYFRSWHWYHRLAMATRTDAELRRAMYDVARMRVRDVLSTTWNKRTGTTAVNNPAPMPAGTTIGQVFASEHMAGLLHRLHVFSPGAVVRNVNGATHASNTLQNIVVAARAATAGVLQWGTPAVPPSPGNPGSPAVPFVPSTWGPDHEEALIAAFMAHYACPGHGTAGHNTGPDPNHSLQPVHNWPQWGANPRHYTLPVATLPAAEQTLRRDRDFAVDVAGLPLPPAPTPLVEDHR